MLLFVCISVVGFSDLCAAVAVSLPAGSKGKIMYQNIITGYR